MDTLFFIFSKLFWMFFAPDVVLLILLIVCLALFWFKQTKKGVALLNILVILFTLVSILPVGKWLFHPLEKRVSIPSVLPDRIDGVLLLGGAERLDMTGYWQQPEVNEYAERYFAFIELIKKYPDATHVYTGGIGSLNQNQPSASDVAKQLLKSQGIDIGQIMFESDSRNTYENGILTQKMVQPGPEENWILITSASHMPRSIGVFNKIGWKIIPFPVDHRVNPEHLFTLHINPAENLKELRSALYEWVGLTAYYLTGKTTPFLPSAKR